MAESDALWEQAAECFCHDDGSLPSIEIIDVKPDELSAIYRMLRERSRLVSNAPPTLWSRTEERSILLESVPDPAALVARGEAEAFHICLGGIMVAGEELPVLGLFVWPGSIELDYRMGPVWTAPKVAGFFGLLKECSRLAPGAHVRPADFEGPPSPDRFNDTWRAYCESGRQD